MNLDTLISSDAVINNNEIKSKKRALEILAEALAIETSKVNQPSIPETNNTSSESNGTDVAQPESHDKEVDSLQIFQLLIEREKLGSTGIGQGVAIPHARTNLTEHAIGAFLKLNSGIDFDSPDNENTDLIFALMVPEHYTDEHLKILAYLAKLFSDKGFCQQLRDSNNSQDIYQQLINRPPA